MQVNFGRVLALCLIACAASAQTRKPVVHTAAIGGETVRYTVSGDLAIAEGDIILGTVAEIEAASGQTKGAVPRAAAQYLNLSGSAPLWPDATLYYTIAPGLANPERVTDAVNDWNTLTPIKVLPRTGQTSYVEFTTSTEGGCASNLGMLGGKQTIVLGSASSCPKAAVVHEIGHALGLLHEQSRKDRNQWLTVLYENIDNVNYLQFQQQSNSRDRGYYDYGSIMHYAEWGFSLDGNAALETVPPGIPIGQRTGLSAGDIDGASRMYGFVPSQTTVTTIPAGLTVIVDGERFTAPHTFAWVPGSSHTIATDTVQTSGAGTSPTRNNFVRWTDGGAAAHTFTASADVTAVAAEFQRSFRVTAGVTSGNGTVTLEPASADGYYTAGTKVKIGAHAGGGQTFYRWSGSNAEAFGYGLAAETMIIEVRSALNFNAGFTSQFMTTVDSNIPGSEILIDGVPYYTPVRFQSFTPGTTHTFGVETPQYDLTRSARFNFGGWEDGSLSTSRTVQIGTTSPTFRANFSRQYYLNYDWSGNGSVTANPDIGYYDEGSTVTLSAVPRGNSALQYWLGDVANGAATQDIVMDRSKFISAVFGQPQTFRPTSAASYSSNSQFDQPGTSVAPLEIVTLFGTGLGPGGLTLGTLDQNGRLGTVAGGTRVLFDGVAAPIVYASADQTSVIVPAEVAGRVFTVISVEQNGVSSGITTASVTTALPGLFTSNASGTGQVASFNQDGSLNSSAKPADPGSVVTLFATGAGLMDRSLPNGAVTDANLARPQLPVSVRIGTQPAEVLYAGSAPTLVHGVLQVNIRIPNGLLGGNQPIKLVVGDYASAPGTTVAVK